MCPSQPMTTPATGLPGPAEHLVRYRPRWEATRCWIRSVTVRVVVDAQGRLESGEVVDVLTGRRRDCPLS
jgi:hypothetical protein